MMKRKGILCCVVIVVAAFLATPAFAGTDSHPLEKTYSAEEILDRNDYLCNVDQAEMNSTNAYLINPKTNEKVILRTYTSPQLKMLQTPYDKLSKVSEDIYFRDVAVDLTAEDLRRAGLSEETGEIWDNGGRVKSWGRFYYKQNYNYVLMTKITGNWRNDYPNAITLSNHVAQAKCASSNTSFQTRKWWPNGGYTYSTGFSEYALIGTSYTTIALRQQVNVTYRNTGETTILTLVLAPWGEAW
ncbi:hypothetical protein ACKQTC_03800 [Peptococcus simiae]|uniref:Uncharacterized protein n=1 Tax=Peptococcus simiae TaxID=1643805 RepID=A0ABW9GXY5_9FIRM